MKLNPAYLGLWVSLVVVCASSRQSFAEEAPLIIPGTPAAPSGPRKAPEAPKPPTDVSPAHFEATVYELKTTPEQARTIETKTLTADAATPDSLLEALSAKGSARILYRIDQPVNVLSERIFIGQKELVTTGGRKNKAGQLITSSTYQQTGVLINLAAAAREGADAAKMLVSLAAELSVTTQSPKEISSGINGTTPRNVKLSHSEALVFDRPTLALSISSASEEDQIEPMVYVLRYRFREAAGK